VKYSDITMESKSLNITVLHKQSKWSKFKRRMSSWFDKDKVDGVSPPEIIVTSHEDLPDDLLPAKIEECHQQSQFSKSQKEDLAKAHQNVITEMRNNLAEARGKDPSSKRNSIAHDGVTASNRRSVVMDPSNKPPVPQTKAAAVAKIRETIAAAKRESCQDLATYSENIPNSNKDDPQESQISNEYQQQQSSTEKCRNVEEDTEQQSPESSNPEPSDEEKEVRKAAIRAKIRDALLNAAASGALAEATNGRVARVTDSPENTHPHPTNQIVSRALQRNSSIRRNSLRGATVQRSSSMRSSQGVQRTASTRSNNQEKPRETIWDFFEQKNKKGICKTCGYVVSVKNNKGGLTRHLSLVHQREYKMYTTKMSQNWTNGMMEKNLNMRVPANF